jgi:hypothetical protein
VWYWELELEEDDWNGIPIEMLEIGLLESFGVVRGRCWGVIGQVW